MGNTETLQNDRAIIVTDYINHTSFSRDIDGWNFNGKKANLLYTRYDVVQSKTKILVKRDYFL